MKWNEFEYLPVALQDAKTRQVLMIQYMTEESVRRTLEEPSTRLWSRICVVAAELSTWSA